MDLGDELVRCHLVRNPDHQCRLPWIGKHRQVAEHDDIWVGHGGAEDVHEALGLRDVITPNLERPAIGVGGSRVVGNQQDAGDTAGCVHFVVIIYSRSAPRLGRSA